MMKKTRIFGALLLIAVLFSGIFSAAASPRKTKRKPPIPSTNPTVSAPAPRDSSLSSLSSLLLTPSPKRELRGVWLATVWGIDWPTSTASTPKAIAAQQKQLCDILDNASVCGLNAVFFQVRSMCDALYASSREPWSAMLTGTRGLAPGWDPLAYAIEQCHARGLECHAWVNPFRWSSGLDYKTPNDSSFKARQWLLSHDKTTVLNPALEEVRAYIVDICREIIAKYPIDGLVFDDYFYPNKIPETSAAPDYTLYKKSGSTQSFGDWRRSNIHKLVADMRCMVTDTRPGLRFGISPAGVTAKDDTSAKHWGLTPPDVKARDWQYSEIYSDPLSWYAQNSVDYISPQIYWPTTHKVAPFEPLVKWWHTTAASHFSKSCYASITLERLLKGDTIENRRDLLRQITLNRRYSAPGDCGIVIYSAKFLPYVKDDLRTAFSRPSLMPAFSDAQIDSVSLPANLRLDNQTLTWKGSSTARYTLYHLPPGVSESEAMTPDGIDGRYLVAVIYGESYQFPLRPTGRIAVCLYTPTGHESAPVWLKP